MKIKNFLKMHRMGLACVSIHQKLYDYKNHRYTKTYFEEETQENILLYDTFKDIANKQVDHVEIIGSGMHKVELCIYLAEE